MKKIVIIISSLLIIIGIIMMYAGYNMAQGRFYGVVYAKGNYTTFIYGCVWLMVGIFVIIGYNIWNHRENELENENTNKLVESKNRTSSFIPTTIKILSIFVIVYGIFSMIYGFSKSIDLFIFKGFGIVLLGFLLFGLSYIIHAAILYINKQKNQ